jgi:hypothetical protein
MSDELTNKLDKLANYMAQRDVFSLQKKELIDQVLTPEIRSRLDEIEAEFAGKMEAIEANIDALEDEIRQEAPGSRPRKARLRVIWHQRAYHGIRNHRRLRQPPGRSSCKASHEYY